MITVATVALLAVLAVIFFRRLELGLFALIVALPFERIGSWALNPTTGHPVVRLSQIVGAALILAYVTNLATKREAFMWPERTWWPLAGFVFSAGISAALVGKVGLLSGWVALAFVATLAFVVARVVSTTPLGPLRIVLLASAGLVGAFGIYQFVAGSLGVDPAFTGLRTAYRREIFGFPRVQSTGLEPLYFANYLLLPLAIGVATLRASTSKRLFEWQDAALGVAALAFILTMSRGAFIGLGVAAVLAIAWIVAKALSGESTKVPWRATIGGAVLLVSLGLSLVGVASFASTGDFLRGPRQFIALATTQLTATGSFTDRTDTRNTALSIFQSHPIWGVGIMGISPYILGYPAVRTPGDIIALNSQGPELLAETGLIGAMLFYGFLVWLTTKAALTTWRKTTSPQARGWILGGALAVMAMTVQAQSFSGFLLTHLWVSYGLLAGIMVRSATLSHNAHKIKA
jgi:O-antigen ligase